MACLKVHVAISEASASFSFNAASQSSLYYDFQYLTCNQHCNLRPDIAIADNPTRDD